MKIIVSTKRISSPKTEAAKTIAVEIRKLEPPENLGEGWIPRSGRVTRKLVPKIENPRGIRNAQERRAKEIMYPEPDRVVLNDPGAKSQDPVRLNLQVQEEREKLS